jgi:DNA-binding MarR family transcriptional regulator
MPTAPKLPHGPGNFKDLFSFKLNVLAHRMSQLAALMNQQMFQLDAREWRILGLLGTRSPLSLQNLANEVGIDKSQASRIVTGLIQRGLLQRNAHDADGRSIHLSLTRSGMLLYKKAFPKAVQRNQDLLSVLSAKDQQVFEQSLDKLSRQASDMLVQARQKQPLQRKRNSKIVQGSTHD